MAEFLKKQYLDLVGLTKYDTEIKKFIQAKIDEVDEVAEKALTNINVNGINGDVKDNVASLVVKAENINYKDAVEESGTPGEADHVEAKAAVTVEGAIAALEAAVGEGGSVANQIKTAIEALDVPDNAEAGKFVKSVSEADGKITVSREFLADTDIKLVAKSSDLAATSLAEYQLVNGNSTALGATIVIPKDQTLKNVEMVESWKEGEEDKEGYAFKFTYVDAEGKDKVVYLDTQKLLFEAEFKNGLEVAENGEVSVKVDASQEKVTVADGEGHKEVEVLSVSEDGVKVSNIQAAIDYAIQTSTASLAVEAQGDQYVSASRDASDNKKVRVVANVVKMANVGESTEALADVKDVKDYVDTHVAAATTSIVEVPADTTIGDAGAPKIVVTKAVKDSEGEDGHVEYTIAGQDLASAKVLSVVNGADTVEGSFRKAIKDAVADLDVTAESKGSNVVVTISETDGKVSLDSVAENYATITYTAATAESEPSMTLTEGDGGKLVKASDVMNAVAYADEKYNEIGTISEASILALFDTTEPQA